MTDEKLITYRLYGRMPTEPNARWGRVGRLSFDSRAEGELVAGRYRKEYPTWEFEIREYLTTL